MVALLCKESSSWWKGAASDIAFVITNFFVKRTSLLEWILLYYFLMIWSFAAYNVEDANEFVPLQMRQGVGHPWKIVRTWLVPSETHQASSCSRSSGWSLRQQSTAWRSRRCLQWPRWISAPDFLDPHLSKEWIRSIGLPNHEPRPGKRDSCCDWIQRPIKNLCSFQLSIYFIFSRQRLLRLCTCILKHFRVFFTDFLGGTLANNQNGWVYFRICRDRGHCF